ncbi:MFS transporter [Kitasatospora sp. MMS16-BH015]|uniref:peptide MFS transporter n=1 Tax=Kitasatospora sp. MMS16-BH015 TaxID=2018025 RepID=UPI000CA0E86B|nr:peptide MFS transporter [Kitasatospora sp. MMS16-BH015]AUG76481.1 MFS transporter [Kitasatospora sp. MMS16-BH015]
MLDSADTQRPEAPGLDRSFFGHPRGLLTLFGTETWERFSFLGMQAILALYFAASTADGGLGMAKNTASSVVAAYGTLVYLLSVVGGWLADRVLGSYRAVLYGGVLIACGHYTMAVPTTATTWLGLGLIIVGTGFLKPNVSTMVGQLYATEDQRRDAGFALYYMGINIGAFLGPLISGWLGQNRGWHWGFSAAALGMTFGIAQYLLGRRGLVRSGPVHPLGAAERTRYLTRSLFGAAAVAALGLLLWAVGWLTLSRGVDAITLVSVLAPAVYFWVMFRSPEVSAAERGRLRPYLVLFLASVVFNLVLFSSYTTLAFLALDHVDNTVFGWTFPSSWWQSVLGVIEVLAAPLVAGLWARLGSRQPHASRKIAYSLFAGGAAFLVLVLPTAGRSGEYRVAALWLVGCYLFMGLGDILLETTGMSATTKLAPRHFASQTMALWFLSLALAQGVSAQLVRLYGEIPDAAYYGSIGVFAVLCGLLLWSLLPWMRRTMHPVH